MRTLVTVARLREIKLHAFRDRTGTKHVTGMTIHGALVVPTRLFWNQLASIGLVADSGFGKEYETYKQCVIAVGDRELYFSVSVDQDGNALLDSVTESQGDSSIRDALVRSLFAARRASLYQASQESQRLGGEFNWDDFDDEADVEVFSQDFEGADSAGADSAGADSAGADSAGADSAGSDSAGSDSAGADSAGAEFEPELEPETQDWPLLAMPTEPSRDLWGWENFHRLPKGGQQILIDGPTGTVRPSVN